MIEPSTLTPLQRRWLNASGIPFRFWYRTLGNLKPYRNDSVVRETVQAWLTAVTDGRVIRATGSQSCGLGLVLIGEPGHGKTTLAAVVAQELIWRSALKTLYVRRPSRPVYFTYYPEMLDLMKRTFDADSDPVDARLMYAIFGRGDDPVQVLVLDDLGKEHRTVSKWAENLFDQLLRARFDAGLPTIITSNVDLTKWAATYGKSMSSFAHEALTPLVIISEEGDRRL